MVFIRDKVNDCSDLRHENSITEFEIIVNKLLKDIDEIITTEENPSFLIVSFYWK
jgi:hypothetical protein